MNQRSILLWGGATGGLAVIIGAFGAHAFHDSLAASGRLGTYELAVQYQFYHALALLVVGSLMTQFPGRLLPYAAVAFCAGIFLFCGSLYLLCFTGYRLLGAVTPIGGVFFIAGWILFISGILAQKKVPQ